MTEVEGNTVSWRELLAETEGRLEAGGDDNSNYCARLICEQASGLEGTEFSVGLNELAKVRQVAALDAMVARRLAGEPIQYVLGHWSFRTLDLFIDKRVLIPRPETEVVAGLAISAAQAVPDAVVVDLGTGSGAIGLSVAAEVPDAQVWLTDLSTEALDVARANLAGIGPGATNVRIAEGSWFDALPEELKGQIDVVVSNPPYVGTQDELGPEVTDWEPASALLAGPEGLDDLVPLVAEAPSWLKPGGVLVLEMAPGQTGAISSLCEQHFSEVQVVKDLAGQDRAAYATLWT